MKMNELPLYSIVANSEYDLTWMKFKSGWDSGDGVILSSDELFTHYGPQEVLRYGKYSVHLDDIWVISGDCWHEEPMKVVENSSYYVGGFGFEPIINTNHPSVGVGAPSIKSARKIWGLS